MNNKQFDVVIPVARKDISFVHHVIKYVRRNIVGVSKIYVVTNKQNFGKIHYDASFENCILLDENNLLEGLSFKQVSSYLKKAGGNIAQTGWYFQQLLKFAFSQTKYVSDYYLTWDADTLPLNKLSFFKDGKPLFTKKIEYHEPYFKTLSRLLSIERQVDFSFIAENMIFKSSVVKEMLADIEKSTVLGDFWVEKVINACDFTDERGNLFSEFETYGNYCIKNHPGLYDFRQLNTFRAAGLIRGRYINENILNRLALDVTIASFEMQDAPFPYNVPWTFERAKNKILRVLRNNGGGRQKT